MLLRGRIGHTAAADPARFITPTWWTTLRNRGRLKDGEAFAGGKACCPREALM